MISAHGLTVRYGKAVAVRDVAFEARSGEVTAVVGPNGAGKSSLLSAVFGSTPATGTVTVDEHDLGDAAAQKRLRTGVAFVPQGRQLFPRLTVRENLEIGARLLGARNDVLESAFDRFPILRTRAKQFAGVLSGGEQQMLLLARALLVQPRALLLDEMTTGLSPKIAGELLDHVRALADSGITVLVAEPALYRVARIVDRGYVMIRGSLSEPKDSADALDTAYRASMGMLEEAL
ncbi:ABC transporter ATP-binding protein [Nocardia flavorosea]|uniref:ATP-binding cassette domain-containing protein n=1 Tax=Nocardia flavorosea TaxID=53429 RepID=A0A846Y5I4_9NOCA|nr:ATP-binding cassette domain-containing protein [Nocardia flavorosea]NKY54786.1 ATP-binding cassette domain-containing protein [Nocardia flavorosea]